MIKLYKHYFFKCDTPFKQSWQPKRKYHVVWKRASYFIFLGHRVAKIKFLGLFTIYDYWRHIQFMVVKAKYFNHVTRQWEYLQENGVDALFDSHPDAQDAVMRQQPRAYNENEFALEVYIKCACGEMVLRSKDGSECNKCAAVYDCWGNRVWTSSRKK